MPDPIDALNEVLRAQYRSLPMFLAGTEPWTHHGDERATAALANIVADQKAMVQRVGEAILDRGGRVETGNFPIEYAELHFLSLDYLLTQLVARQKDDVATLERCVEQLAGDRAARTLAEEALGSERAHLETLEHLLADLGAERRNHPASMT